MPAPGRCVARAAPHTSVLSCCISKSLVAQPVRGRYGRLGVRVDCLRGSNGSESTSDEKGLHNFGLGQERIGADYGEGFVNFKIRDVVDNMDVDWLNTTMQTRGAERLRLANNPDQAIGVIFSFEAVLADTRNLQQAARKAQGNPLNGAGSQKYDLHPLRAMMSDSNTSEHMSDEDTEACIKFLCEAPPLEKGVSEWLIALKRSQVPCAVVSNLRRSVVRGVLSKMDLLDFFQSEVCYEDGMETMAQTFLSASMKLGRPPNQCVVFTGTPQGVAAAHNCTMKAVAVLGQYKGYQLKQADLTCAKMDELSVYNLRRLFANCGGEFMDTMKQKSNPDRAMSKTRVAAGGS